MALFSHSKISSYEQCPLQYKFAYIDQVKVEAKDTVETFLGSRVHEALEKLYKDLFYEKPMPLEELLSYYRSLWEKNWKDSIIIVKEDYTPENYRKMGERYLSDYYKRHKPFARGKVMGLETQDLLSLDEQEAYKFHIRIDRLVDMGDGQYEVHDYKTNSILPPQEDLDKDRQLAMYALWVKKRFKDFQKVRLVWHFLAFGKEMESFRTAEELEELRLEVLSAIKKIEAEGEFPPVVSSRCQWCLYHFQCPMWKHEQELEAKPENEYLDDPGLKLVDEYVRIKEELDAHTKEASEKLEKLKEALIAFCEREGVAVVFGSDQRIHVKEYESLKFPLKNTEEREKLIEVLKGLNRYNEVVELDVYALARTLKNREWDEETLKILREFGSLERSYRFIIQKKH